MASARADTASGIDQTEVTIGAFAEFVATTGFSAKPRDMAVVYIGFRCIAK